VFSEAEVAAMLSPLYPWPPLPATVMMLGIVWEMVRA
jgi:hypothetical protein